MATLIMFANHSQSNLLLPRKLSLKSKLSSYTNSDRIHKEANVQCGQNSDLEYCDTQTLVPKIMALPHQGSAIRNTFFQIGQNLRNL